MVASDSSNLAVGDTDAGQLVGDSEERRLRAAGRDDKIDHLKAVLRREFDQGGFKIFDQERK